MKIEHNPPLSTELKAFMRLNKVATVDALILLTDEELIGLPGFGWRLFNEILLLRQVQ